MGRRCRLGVPNQMNAVSIVWGSNECVLRAGKEKLQSAHEICGNPQRAMESEEQARLHASAVGLAIGAKRIDLCGKDFFECPKWPPENTRINAMPGGSLLGATGRCPDPSEGNDPKDRKPTWLATASNWRGPSGGYPRASARNEGDDIQTAAALTTTLSTDPAELYSPTASTPAGKHVGRSQPRHYPALPWRKRAHRWDVVTKVPARRFPFPR